MSQIWLMQGDTLEEMEKIPTGSIDMICADLPYGTTACSWDTIIPFVHLWAAYKRIIKKNGAIVLTASQPFTSALVMSNPADFRYCWVWDKVNRVTGSLHAAQMPLKQHEDIAVFYSALPTYNPQMLQKERVRYGWKGGHGKYVGGRDEGKRFLKNESTDHYPQSIIPFSACTAETGLHPTQKPEALLRYLILTYTNEGETVLDNTMGSGTTGVASVQTNQNFIGIEKDVKYFAIAKKRIEDSKCQGLLGLEF